MEKRAAAVSRSAIDKSLKAAAKDIRDVKHRVLDVVAYAQVCTSVDLRDN
jgi:phosphoenolpyruvate-protein kinase (PTS system EI component)